MIRFLVLLMMLGLAAPALAQERPGESQRRAPGGMTASDGIAGLMAEVYGAATGAGGYPPMRYFSRRLQREIARDRARPAPRVPADWLRRGDVAWPAPDFHAWVLNTSGAGSHGPASAAVSLGFDRGDGWGRRVRLIDEGGYWVIDEVCMFPEILGLSDALNIPGPTEPGYDPQPIARRNC